MEIYTLELAKLKDMHNKLTEVYFHQRCYVKWLEIAIKVLEAYVNYHLSDSRDVVYVNVKNCEDSKLIDKYLNSLTETYFSELKTQQCKNLIWKTKCRRLYFKIRYNFTDYWQFY